MAPRKEPSKKVADKHAKFLAKEHVETLIADEWANMLADGRVAVYTSNIAPGTGGVLTARVGDITLTQHVSAPMTRQEVEAFFAPTLAKP